MWSQNGLVVGFWLLLFLVPLCCCVYHSYFSVFLFGSMLLPQVNSILKSRTSVCTKNYMNHESNIFCLQFCRFIAPICTTSLRVMLKEKMMMMRLLLGCLVAAVNVKRHNANRTFHFMNETTLGFYVRKLTRGNWKLESYILAPSQTNRAYVDILTLTVKKALVSLFFTTAFKTSKRENALPFYFLQ